MIPSWLPSKGQLLLILSKGPRISMANSQQWRVILNLFKFILFWFFVFFLPFFFVFLFLFSHPEQSLPLWTCQAGIFLPCLQLVRQLDKHSLG